MLKSFGGHPIFNNIANSPSLLTRSKALVRSMKALYKRRFRSLHFSCSCRTEKIISVVERLDLNPHKKYKNSSNWLKLIDYIALVIKNPVLNKYICNSKLLNF